MHKTNYTVITGASLGLGKALAWECAKRGMNLILVALPASGLPALLAEIQSCYRVNVEIIETDLCRPECCDDVLAWVKESGWEVNVLINNLGGGSTELFAAGHLRQYEKQIELNVLSTVRLSHLFLSLLQKTTPAYILNVASLAAYFTVPQKGIYSASKAFILSFSKTLREELKESNISVSVVCPSGMPTNALSVQMIERGSFVTKISCMKPADVARIALSGMVARKRVIVPGALNRFFLLINQLLPCFIKRLLLRSAMKRLKENNSTPVVPVFPVEKPVPVMVPEILSKKP